MMNGIFYIDCRVSAYGGEPIRVICEYDAQNEIFVVTNTQMNFYPPKNPFKNKTKEQIELIKSIQKNSVIVVDSPSNCDEYDQLFVENEHLDEAVRAYYLLEATKSLKNKRTVNFDTIIALRKLDVVGGRAYEISSDEVTNEHMAIIISCWSAIKLKNSLSFFEEETPTESDLDDFNAPFSF